MMEKEGKRKENERNEVEREGEKKKKGQKKKEIFGSDQNRQKMVCCKREEGKGK